MATPGPARILPIVAGLLLAALATSGCSGQGGRDLPPEWRGRDLTEPGWENATIRPGWGIGLEYVWSSGAEIKWDWIVNGSGIVHFQVIRMEGGRAQTVRSTFANESASSFTVIRSGAHQLVFRNESFLDIHVWYKVPEGHLTRVYSPSEGPDCTFLLATGAGGTACAASPLGGPGSPF